MRQILISKAGGPDVLKIKESPAPIPRNGELRIKVEAAGINPSDITCRLGQYDKAPRIPFIPGFEVAGTIDVVAQGVSGFREGDKVLAYTNFGGYSDTVCVPHLQVFKRLDWMSALDGAALPVDFLTAYVTLIIMGSLHLGDSVLIHDAADGIGIAVLDICRMIGAKAFGVANSDKHHFLRERGLDYPIDKRDIDYEQVIRETTSGHGVDIVISRVGINDWKKDYRVLASTGRLVHLEAAKIGNENQSILQNLHRLFARPSYTVSRLIRDNKSVAGFNLANLWDQGELVQNWMGQIISWYDEALFRPVIDKTFPFSQAADAHQYIQNRENNGKVLLIP